MANSDFGVGLAKMAKNGVHGIAAARPTAHESKPSKARGREAATSREKSSARNSSGRGLTIGRRFTRNGENPLDTVVYERRSSNITNPDGTIVFKMDGAEVPSGWSQLATDIVISKYFRKAGLFGDKDRGETSVRQVVYRIAHTIRSAADRFGGYFASKSDADAFESELSFLLVNQYGAFNSPVWFNCGLWHEYKILGSGGNWAVDIESGATTKPTAQTRGLPSATRRAKGGLPGSIDDETRVIETEGAYERPQCSACFIQAANDDLMSIYELVKSEARLFKYGSGTGSNFSSIRGKQEKLSGGGTSSGLMSFLEVFDRAAGATKSGGTTRRAAKMVCLDMDHPEIEGFINWKVREERKAHALIAAGFSSDFNGEAYHTISGQNSNNSVRVTDDFMRAALIGGKWQTVMRTTGKVCDTYDAKNLWQQIAEAAWACADPGVQYDTTINRWHTCPNTSPIRASNPCSEYMFLDDSACNLASVNLIKFLTPKVAERASDGAVATTRAIYAENGDFDFDIEGYRHACRIFFMAQEILVDLSSYPTKNIAKNSHDYRPLGLGYANLGSLLMQLGVPYDSDRGRSIAAALTAIMCGHAYKTSAEMAKTKGPFAGFAKNREPMLRVMNMHRDAAYAISREDCPTDLYRAACEDWDDATELGVKNGYRNAQSTVLAPTGTIGLLMDCDTTGIEPDFALVKFKKLAGGGYFKIVNQSVPAALRRLGYGERELQEIVAYVSGTNTLLAAPVINRRALRDKGLTDGDLAKVESALPGVFDLDAAFGAWVIGEEAYERLGVTKEARSVPGFSLLERLGFSRDEIDRASDVVIGRMTIEGAPYLEEKHYAVFDCANRCGKTGQRYLAPMSHVRMMASAQPFLSGAISKTVNLPNDASVEEVAKVYEEGWRLGLKAVALYRDGCKASQPLSTSSKEKETTPAAKASDHSDEAPSSEALSMTSPELAPIPKTSAPQDHTQLMLQITDGKRPHGLRVRLPKKRTGFTQEARVGGHKIFLRTGEYEDGTLGEIFIDMHKEGAAFRSLMNCFAMSISIGLQYGVPLETYVEQFTFTRFEPQGLVEGHPYVKFGTSIVDYLFRVLGVEYLHRYDLAHIKPEEHTTQSVAENAAPAAGGYPAQRPLNYTKEAVARSAVMSEGLEGTVRTLPAAATTAATIDRLPSAPSATLTLGKETSSPLDAHLDAMMGDAPVCDVCGHITVRNGACYKCLNCGNSMGCS
jgi:ribonucleoside-diphosphate reductase alpha chain